MQKCNGSNSTPIPLGDLIGSGVLGSCFMLGVPGNMTVVVILLRHFKRDNFSLHLMLSLATLPVWIYSLLCGWVFGPALCKFLFFIVYTSLYASLLTVSLMSVQRFLMILYPVFWAKLGRAVWWGWLGVCQGFLQVDQVERLWSDLNRKLE